VIAGSAAGLRLVAPGPATRPLADRVKQTLFAILEPDLPGATVLDLFAGSGAAGIEALSRGAARAVFVDRDVAAIRTIRTNLERTGLTERADVRADDALAYLRADAGRAGPRGPGPGPFDLVVVDPPYQDVTVLRSALDALGAVDGPLRTGARVVVKHFWRTALPEATGLLRSERSRRFGETALTFYRALGEGNQP
jgi:16S rRNA (guanine(966)-N(2))-methyltransferase RsmD